MPIRISTAIRRLNRHSTIPPARKYLIPFNVKGLKIAILCRVSSREQGKGKSLKAQEAHLHKLIAESGGEVVYVKKYKWSGYGKQWEDKVARFGKEAIKRGAQAIVVATLDRLIRSSFYQSNSDDWQAMPIEEQIERITNAVKLPVMTYADPESSAGDNRSLLIKWSNPGRKAKNTGKGCKKRNREECLGEVLYLRGLELSYGVISFLTGVKVPTVQLWVRKYALLK